MNRVCEAGRTEQSSFPAWLEKSNELLRAFDRADRARSMNRSPEHEDVFDLLGGTTSGCEQSSGARNDRVEAQAAKQAPGRGSRCRQHRYVELLLKGVEHR